VYNNDRKFYTLYGHLSCSSLQLFNKGDHLKKGDLIAYVGDESENGNWSPHLHFQLMLDMLGNTIDFPGVAFPSEFKIWQSMCPDPNLLFQKSGAEKKTKYEKEKIIAFRKEHLGLNLSLSYKNPLEIVRGEGVYLFDETGRKYLDTVNNVAHVGHEHSRIVEAGQKQMAVLNTNTRYLHYQIIEFADKLLHTFPKELSVVYFVNSGSEANELALRMAKTYTRQKDMIAVEVGYHGNTNACIEVSSYKFDSEGGQGCPEHTHIVPLPDAFRGIYQGVDAGERYASHVKQQLENIQHKGRNVAAFICESIISCGGQIELPANYLKVAYKAIHEAGGVCIADEVQVGCGRVGSTFWGFQLHDVVPDIVTIGKPIGNGHPLAAVVCSKQIADAFANGMEYFNTFGGNPVSCAIGKEVLQVIEDEKLQENALLVGNYLKDELKKIQKEFPIIGDVRGQGLFLGFELNGRDKEPLGEKASYLVNRMRDFAILMSTDGPDHNVIKIKPPMVFSKENADELICRLSMVFKEDFMQLTDR
jgi:4-aminobutyrate aminotransferase-like enzyme